MVTFNQAYWYTHACPLRRIDKTVCPETEGATALRNIVHNSIIDYFDKDILDIKTDIIDKLNIKSIKTGLNKEAIIKRVNQLLINYEIWKTKHKDTEILAKNVNTSIKNMEFSVDIARYKPLNSRIQLIWFRYDSIVPSLSEFARLVEQSQWNARGFQLFSGEKPMQLTYFFPVLGTEYSVLYNLENGYNIISDLIEKEVFFTKPSIECDICDACPMTWSGYKGEIHE